MKEIRMVDLKGQYLKIKKQIDSTLLNVIEKTEFINGSEVKLFQQNLERYLQIKHVIPCANGTDALQIALMSLNLSPGDEVITSGFTFVATLEVIALLGLKPVIVDVDPQTFNISIEALQKAVTPKTKAIIPVHLFGQCADMESILQITKDRKIAVIEDNAQALGSVYTFSDGTRKFAGTMGDLGTTSFFPSKNLGCYGDGGAIFTDNDHLAQMARSIANHGMKVRYHHDHIGINSRLDSIQAGILNIKLNLLDGYNESRRNAAEYYDNKLGTQKNVRIPRRDKKSNHIFHQYTVILEDIDREGLRTHLQSKGIPSMIYYPIPLHLQAAYKYLGYKEGDFPVSERLCKTVLSLPMHTELDNEQLKFVTDSVLEYIQ